MPASYPAVIKIFTTLVDGVEDVLAAHQNDPNAEITAIETELGTNPRGTAVDVKARLDAAHTTGGLHTAKIAQADLKTAIGEVSTAVSGLLMTLPGGEYGFYPQVKSSTANSENTHITLAGFTGEPVTLGTTYATRIYLNPDSGQTLFAQQRYVTASGQDLWVFALVDPVTGDIVAAWQAPDHPAYGQRVSPELLPHPFVGSALAGLKLVVLPKADAEALRGEAATQTRSLLTILQEEMTVDLGTVAVYVPLHTGLFDDQNQPVLLPAPPSGTEVRPMKLISPGQRRARHDRALVAFDAAQMRDSRRAAKRISALAKLKTGGLDDDELDALFGKVG